MWAQPDDAVLLPMRHAAAVSARVSAARPRAWRTLWLSSALLVLLMMACDGVPAGPSNAYAIATVLAVLLIFGAWCTSACLVMRAISFDEIGTPTLAHTASERTSALDFEDSAQWEDLLEKTTEYVELRGCLAEHRTVLRDSPNPEAEQARLHLRCAALALRQYHAAWTAAETATGGGDEVLAAVPAVHAENAIADFDEHLHSVEEAMVALRPVALAAKIDAQLRPLSLPAPVSRTSKPSGPSSGRTRKRSQVRI